MASNQIDEKVEQIKQNVNNEMECSVDNNFEKQMHKDPLNEANKYMCKKDIFELFKQLTANLVLKKPKDPIRDLIEQLKEIEQSQTK